MNVRLTAATPSTLSFAWDAVAGRARYEVLTDGSGMGTAYTNSYTVLWGLAPDTSHTFAVRSVSSAGVASAYSAPITARTLRDTTAPGAPVVTGSATGFSSVAPDVDAVHRRLQLRLLQRLRQRPPVAADAPARPDRRWTS